MSIPQNRQAAKGLVEQIAKDHGYLGEEKLRRIDTDLRQEIEEAFLKKDLMIGSTVITLSKNLYSSKARFVFELLQNADDNSYAKARASGAEPYISFRVYPNRIVVECNEDGFTHENLVAICSVGQSSKIGAQGYIGEKGIGFKSVFMAAWKVHIQSGAFSFSFTHRTGDSGMGMISPVWEECDELQNSPLTRITLHLHATGEKDVLARARQTIREQFEELQETLLLFMKNLRRIHVAFYNESEAKTSSASYSVERPQENYAILKRTKVTGNTTEDEVARFHVTTYQASNIAKSENRQYSENEEHTRAYSKSEIVLAFPLTDALIPVIRNQHLHVFLPVRSVGFTFLIQADFVTDASREDVVKDSLRNQSLLNGVADAFIKAVVQMCVHKTLQYRWMRYLPDKKSTTWGKLWPSLVDKIADRLSKTPVLFGRIRPHPRLIKDMYRLGSDVFDENGQPLLDDVENDQIISSSYQKHDLALLTDYGLRLATFEIITIWLKNDLARGPHSRMQSPQTSEGWHTKAALLFQLPFVNNWLQTTSQLKAMNLIPLQTGEWVSASSGPVYFEQVGGMHIPPDIGLRFVPKLIKNTQRKKLFEHLGVKSAAVSRVRNAILSRYPSTSSTLYALRAHLHFLYLSQQASQTDRYSYSRLSISDADKILRQPTAEDMYIASEGPCGPKELFKKTSAGTKPGDGAPGYSAPFVHPIYFEESPKPPEGQDLKWVDWFYSHLGVHRIVRFGGSELTKATRYIQEHRPEKFLECIRLWVADGHTIDPRLVTFLRETKILCRGNHLCLLKDAYFPTEELERRVGKFVERNAFFPWLWLDKEETPDTARSEWKSVSIMLGVGTPSNHVAFALDMLKYTLDAIAARARPFDVMRLFALYEHIYTNCRDAENPGSAQKMIQNAFSNRPSIYIPMDHDHCDWATPDECVWDAPQTMESKYALKHLYESRLIDDSLIPRFFKSTLGITGCTWQIYVLELKALKASGCVDIDTITGIYTGLDKLRSHIIGIAKDEVRAEFDDNALIYMPCDDDRTWHTVSQCVWSSAARLRGRVSLNDEYTRLERLFVNFLGVKPVDLPMAIDELKEFGNKSTASEEQIKELIWTVNSLLSTTTRPPSSREVVKGRIFPIKQPNRSVSLLSKAIQFFVPDRDSLRRAFEKKVKFLNFTLEEVVRLRPFLEWTELVPRLLSDSVKEVTSFHGGIAKQTPNPDRQIRNRAHALLRIAFHFDSPRTHGIQKSESFYQILKNAEICETNGISSDLILVQDGDQHKVQGEMTTLHVAEDQSGLKVYLPPGKDDQEYIFANLLSQRLFEWMMTDPLTQIPGEIKQKGVSATRDVLLSPLSKLARALDDNGIATVDIEDTDQEVIPEPVSPSTPLRASPSPPVRSVQASTEGSDSETQVGSDSESDRPSLASSVSPQNPQIDRQIARHSSEVNASSSYAVRPRMSGAVQGELAPARQGSPLPEVPQVEDRPRISTPAREEFAPVRQESPLPEEPEVDNRPYVALLDNVIRGGRGRSLPVNGARDTTRLGANGRTDWGLRFSSQIERDSMVGAAGELYVFELLSQLLQSNGFSRRDWQSTIRRYARVHPEYASMEPWTGIETSDIVYEDTEGKMTDSLIEKGYLDRNLWAGRRPKYFVEVKATTLQCETRFFMSRAQFQRMKDNTRGREGAENLDTIYANFRVYNLGQDNMGVRIYIDPESLRTSRRLRFTAEQWSVVPTEI